MKNIIKLIAKNEDKNLRIDSFLAKKKDLSRTRIKNLILKKKLKINGKVIESPSKKISSEDHILFEIPKPKTLSLKAYNFKLNIIYEDEDLMVINKPAGISMHPGPGNYDNTIVNALINYDVNSLSNIGDELRPGIVHRIDKDTSGLVVIAKNNKTHEHLSNQFKMHKIKRVYQTLIWGKIRPQNGKIKTFVRRSNKNRQLMQVSLCKGKTAITNYSTLEIFENKNTPTFSLLECELETGRTHQIRVHMSFKGNNILGDKKYKKKFKKFKNISSELNEIIIGLNRQFLHARVLGFLHPIKGKYLEFSSKLPYELENILKRLRNTSKL